MGARPAAVQLVDRSGATLAIAPNPASTVVTVTLAGPAVGDSHVLVSDMEGRIVARFRLLAGEMRVVMPVLDLNNGTYVVSIDDAAAPCIGKFVVRR